MAPSTVTVEITAKVRWWVKPAIALINRALVIISKYGVKAEVG
jgi:hypothetical protein